MLTSSILIIEDLYLQTFLHTLGVDDNEEDELEMAGLNRDELEYMDEDERREAMEDAGLDPDNYDF